MILKHMHIPKKYYAFVLVYIYKLDHCNLNNTGRMSELIVFRVLNGSIQVRSKSYSYTFTYIYTYTHTHTHTHTHYTYSLLLCLMHTPYIQYMIIILYWSLLSLGPGLL
jgi:hypothetical protein